MPDRETVIKVVEYLNWYFTQDDGTADKNDVKAWKYCFKSRSLCNLKSQERTKAIRSGIRSVPDVDIQRAR